MPRCYKQGKSRDKKSSKPVPSSTAVILPPKAVLTHNFFTPLRTTGAENTLTEQVAPRKLGRPPPIMMISTTNLIQLQSNLKDHFKREHNFWNTRNGTCIVTKEMPYYSAMNPTWRKIMSTILPSPQIPKSLSRQWSVTFPQTCQQKIFSVALRT
jgi:hypothetical protein